jgi:bacterioferritin-associated ferredoxin
MFVCICRAVTDRQIRNAIAGGARSMRELREKLGVCSDCGKCGPCAKEMLSEQLPIAARPAA